MMKAVEQCVPKYLAHAVSSHCAVVPVNRPLQWSSLKQLLT